MVADTGSPFRLVMELRQHTAAEQSLYLIRYSETNNIRNLMQQFVVNTKNTVSHVSKLC